MKRGLAEKIDTLITINVKLLVLEDIDKELAEKKVLLIKQISEDSGYLTSGEIVDRLSTIVIKCFMAQDSQAAAYKQGDMAKAGEFGQLVMELNAKRNQFMRKLDILLGQKNETVTPKIFDGEKWSS